MMHKVEVMKIVHIATTDFGGAFKAVQRIRNSMQPYCEQADILVRSRFFETDTIEVVNTLQKRILSKGRNFLNLLLSHGEVVTDWFGADLSRHLKVRQADVIILHWVNSFVSSKSVKRLARLRKPIIWVMHDMWVFTGGCHYDSYCDGYEKGCGNCPYLGKRLKKDISYWNLKVKKRLFDNVDILFIAISQWEKECALNSIPLKGKNVIWVSNPVDISVFCPLNRDNIKKKYGVAGKKVILFGADKALENPMKGFSYLIDALQYLEGEKYLAVCFGKAPKNKRIMMKHMEIHYLGEIRDEKELSEWYNIADVFVAPSLQEGFGYTVCEALACGTPVTAFAVGGMLDQIIHEKNGYLAKLYDAEDLAAGIKCCVENRERFGAAARERVVSCNSYKVIGERYKKLCQEAIESNGSE